MIMDKNHLSKTLIGDLWFVSNNFTDAFTNVQSVQKKKSLPASFHRYFYR
jgi:hypothetical protein